MARHEADSWLGPAIRVALTTVGLGMVSGCASYWFGVRYDLALTRQVVGGEGSVTVLYADTPDAPPPDGLQIEVH
jgi:hypothetical protein